MVLADRLQPQKDRQQHEMYETVEACKDDLHGQGMEHGVGTCSMFHVLERVGTWPTHARRPTWPTLKMWSPHLRRGQQDTALKHGPWCMHAETRSQRTSQTDVGQGPPEWCYTCLRELLIAMGPSDGRSAITIQKCSSRTTDRPTWTISGVCMHRQSAQRTQEMWPARQIHVRRFAW